MSSCLILGIGKRVKESKAIPLTGRGGPYSCEMLWLPYFLDNRLTDGGKAVTHLRRSCFTLKEDSWYSFLLQDEQTPSP
jgi:hypothetical protein